MKIYSYSTFGYEGAIVEVEVDVRSGIPAVDIVGLADSAVKEERERVRCAIKNSNLSFPSERVLIALSPADLKKDGASFDLGIALAILNHDRESEPVMVLGELELSGNVRPVRGVHAAINSAIAGGIKKFIIPKANKNECEFIDGEFIFAENLALTQNALLNDEFIKITPNIKTSKDVEFDESTQELPELDKKLVRAISIAVAGKHHLLAVGAPGCGKTLAIQGLVPQLTPKLTTNEAQVVTRIHSIAGLMNPQDTIRYTPPFRIPHQTASIEGMCGGGVHCNPGEISLAHNGTLFLDEAAEFRTSVLQILRVPLESHAITLARAGRSTVYPADFQLMLTTNPCPCGNYGYEDRICLCSARSVEMYWKKFSGPLLDRISLRVKVDNKDKVKVNIEELRSHIKTAYEIQRSRGVYNEKLTPSGLAEYCNISDEASKLLDEYVVREDASQRCVSRIKKVALTIANMDGRTQILVDDMKEAIDFQKTGLEMN